MKSLCMVALVTMLSGTSQALVSDRFKCAMELEDLSSGNKSKQEQEFNVTRMSLSASPAPDVRLTGGTAKAKIHLIQSTADLSAELNLFYQHAARVDSNDKPLEARQTTCLNVGYSYCEKSGNPPYGCNGVMSQCLVLPDPFDPNHGWTAVGLVDGVPGFNSNGLTSEFEGGDGTGMGKKVARIKIACQYLGTYY